MDNMKKIETHPFYVITLAYGAQKQEIWTSTFLLLVYDTFISSLKHLKDMKKPIYIYKLPVVPAGAS